jgi:peroxiredoxin
MSAKPVIILLFVALLASIGGALAYRTVYFQAAPDQPNQSIGDPSATAADLIGMKRPEYTLGSSTGEYVSADKFDGEVVLLNFWATWCKPCREEMPMLVRVNSDYQGKGFQVVGVALDDVQQAREFASELGVDYTILVGSTDVMAMVSLYGNRSGVLPYSVLIDREGIIRWAHVGIIDELILTEQIESLL